MSTRANCSLRRMPLVGLLAAATRRGDMSHRTCGLQAGHTRCMRRCPQPVGAAGLRGGAVKSEQLRKVLDATPAPRPFGAAICPWPEADPSRRWVRTGFGRFGRGGKAQAPPKAAQWATLGGACCLATAPRQASKAGKRRAWVGHERPLPSRAFFSVLFSTPEPNLVCYLRCGTHHFHNKSPILQGKMMWNTGTILG